MRWICRLWLLGLLPLLGCAHPDPPPPPPLPTSPAVDLWSVRRVIDGDTILVAQPGREERVRLLGVNTPETVHPSRPVESYGREASVFLHRLLDGRTVRLEHPPGSDTVDRWGRLVAYVYREPDGMLVNLEIVRQGYGHALTDYPFEGMDAFRAAERDAREAGRGLWAAPDGGQPVTTR